MAPVPEMSRRFLRRTWVRRALPAGGVALLLFCGTVVTRANANAGQPDTYRTATATIGSVEQRLNLTGSVERVNQVTQAFPVTGTVVSVSVSVGDTVTAGEALATLDPAPLGRAVTAAEATLAKARATLESDQSTTTVTSNTSNTNGTSSATGATSTPAASQTTTAAATPATSPRNTSPTGGSGSHKSLAQAEQRVTRAQGVITADLRRASAALAQCGPFLPSATSPSASPSTTASPPSPTGTATSPASTATAGDPSSTAAPTPDAAAATPSDAEIRACVGALRTVPTQQQIQRDQQALTDSQSALMTTVTLAITTAGATTATPGPTAPSTAAGQSSSSRSATSQSTTGQSATGQSASNQSAGGQSGGTGQSTASRAISDQAAITNALASLNAAKTDLASATLKASATGTVGSVSLLSGSSSQGKSVIVVGAGAVEVTVNVPLASIAKMHVGQKANVTPQGATTFVPGAVTSISLLPTTSTGSTGSGTGQGSGSSQGTAAASDPTYPVVVLVPDALPALASGSRADVSLLLGTASRVLTVPNSALTPLADGQAMAVTLKKGVATRSLVKTGYAGTLTTEVTSGLVDGQQVVLADLSTALPTNSTSSRRVGVGGTTGGLGGAGLGGMGAGGGTFTGGPGFPPRG
jgi:multidrug efflux pump subunit AcrA (membrane-fusion protein)